MQTGLGLSGRAPFVTSRQRTRLVSLRRCLAPSDGHIDHLRIAELVRVAGFASNSNTEAVVHNARGGLEAIGVLPVALGRGTGCGERAPLAAIEGLEIDDLEAADDRPADSP